MFVNEQVDKSLEFKVKAVEYEQDAQRPFENLLHEFQNDWFIYFVWLSLWIYVQFISFCIDTLIFSNSKKL